MQPQTFSDLVTEALGANLPDFDSSAYLARAQQWVNDGLRDMARRVNIPALEATATVTLIAGTSSYPLPADCVRILALVDRANTRALEQVDQRDLDVLRVSSGMPYSFALYANQLALFPTPDRVATLTLRYQKDPATLAGMDVQGTIPDEYAHMIVCFVRARLFRAEDDYEAAGIWLAEYERQLVRLRADIQRQAPFRVRQIPGRRGLVRWGG